MLSSLVSEWTFDELTPDGKTKDTWGSNHGTVHGAEWVDDCVYGKCYSFNGTSHYIETSFIPDLAKSTISLWAKMQSYGQLFGLYNTSPAERYHLGPYETSGWLIGCGNQYKYISFMGDNPITKGGWYHLVMTTDENTAKLYINGVYKEKLNFTNQPIVESIWVGGRNGALFSPIKSLIDDVRIYNSALSSAQVKQNYIAGLNSMLVNGNLFKDEYNERLEALASN